MTPHRLLNLALAAAIAVVLSTSYLLDGQPNELDAIQATAASVADAQNAARATARHTRTAQVQP